MHRNRSHGCDDQRSDSEQRKEATSKQQDAMIGFAVLTVVLYRQPTQLTVAELEREIVDDPDSFGQVDAVARAVRDLAGAGLLHRHGEFVLPTRAAVCFDYLSRNR